jgi:outer membrane lipoprotein
MARNAMNTAVAVVLVLVGAAGCASMVDAVGQPEAQRVSPKALHASPELYQGHRVMLGGTIIAATRRSDGTELEVRAHPLGRDGRPELGALTTGPFVVRSPRVLDATTHASGRSITVVGEVAPPEQWGPGDSSSRYPVLTFADLRLWPPDTSVGGVSIQQRYWVWPYTFWWGPPPYVPLVKTW